MRRAYECVGFLEIKRQVSQSLPLATSVCSISDLTVWLLITYDRTHADQLLEAIDAPLPSEASSLR
jgi:hypothetical protein